MPQTATLRPGRLGLLLAVSWGLSASPSWAATPKKETGFLESKAFFRPELALSSSHARLETIEKSLPNQAAWGQFRAASAAELAPGQTFRAYVDPRGGAASNIMGAFPLIPGEGLGNDLRPASLGVAAVDAGVVGRAVRAFVERHRGALGVDATQLGEVRAVQVREDLWQFTIPQVVRGVAVRDARVAGTIVKGNLVLIGAENWGNVRISPHALVTAEQALEKGSAYIEGRIPQDEMLKAPALEILPVAPAQYQDGERFNGPVGKGYSHRLVWSYVFRRPPDDARWETIVDAHSGEVIAFQDINLYVQRQVTGGVYPVTSTEVCPTAGTCGTMQSGWPMPFADTGLASPNNFTNSAGVFDYTSGTVTTTLTGQFVDIVDNCGAISQSGAGDVNMGGTNGQHDCTAVGSAGNTPASRTAFYETNKLVEMARGYLPANTWLQSRLTTNVNINNTCNAFWNGVSINFYRSGGGCRNTGELAGVFDHEWGHGLDDNDAGGALSNSSEAYADIAAVYRLQDSCVGHGFFQTIDDGCGMTADGTGFNSNEAQQGAAHCDLNCSGVRDADWDRHADHTPDTALGFVCTSCTTGTGPCGRQVHCAAAPSRQAAWDLVARDLQAAPFSYDSQTAFIIGNKLFYQGSGNIGAWHACTCGSSSSGCGSTNAYMQWLAADDDNGNVNDGTPHMTAIHAAFNRHGIACSTPTPTNSGCAGGPTVAPTLSATAGNFSVSLSWGAIAGATRYWVFRTEGHAGCNFGKALIAEVTATSYTDTKVANGRTYFYNVVAAGSSSACFGPASSCVSATPAAPTNPDFSVSCSPSSLTVTQGASTTSTCTVSSVNGFASAVDLSCTGMPAGSTCSFSPAAVTPPANGSANSTLTVSSSATAATGNFSFQVQGLSGSLTRTFGMTLTVNASGGGGAQTAVFDATLQAPKCGTVGSSCDTGATLVRSRDTLATPETNQPNTINDSCADGTSGTYLTDESVERIKVVSVDGTNFAAGKQVRVEATVHVWPGGPTSDHLDIYQTANASSPAWTAVATNITPTSTQTGIQTFSATHTLPTGSLQAVRAQFRFMGSASTCTSGSYNDRDDLVFAVTGGGGGGAELITNGGFEGTLSPWVRSGNAFHTTTGAYPHSGTGYVYLGAANSVTGSVYQQFAIPATASGTGSFWLNVTSSETTTTTQFDKLFVEVRNTAGTLLATLATYSNLNKGTAGVYSQKSLNLSAYKGQTIRLQFRATTDFSLVTTFRVDDVSVK